MIVWQPIVVRTYAGYCAEESPRAFRLGSTWYRVARVFGRIWERTVEGREFRLFRVMTEDGETFTLRYDVESESWSIETQV
ncbi:MAG: hypothetical protein D6723_05060 [Acidobacteria bacterium]|nr:MAG: hypothetical protein D6723_05060 [Acidobacteriota bacterium]